MNQGCGLDLKNVVCHVPGRDISLRKMEASRGVSMEITIAMSMDEERLEI